VFVVLLDGRAVAASIVHWHGRTIEVPWASSLREFNPLCANVLLYWQMLRFAGDTRFTTFDFGRSTPGESTYRFKKQWGAEPRELVWEYWMADGRPMPELNPHNPKYAFAIRTWQRLPVGVTTRIGPLVVRNIP
jgi:serine/alanine adding enzyme